MSYFLSKIKASYRQVTGKLKERLDMFIEYNVNPYKRVGDCVVRAIAMFLGESWEDTYWSICEKGAEIYDMPSSNEVWGEYLLDIGCKRHIIPNECRCYTVKDFC